MVKVAAICWYEESSLSIWVRASRRSLSARVNSAFEVCRSARSWLAVL